MGIDELKAKWNAQADYSNQWDDLGVDEIVAFAQQQVLLDAAEMLERSYADSNPIRIALRRMAQKEADAIPLD